jgi:hypothetical protein
MIPENFVRLAKFGKKQPSYWLKTKETQKQIYRAAEALGTLTVGGKYYGLVLTFNGGDSEKQGTWVHPILVSLYEEWLAKNNETTARSIFEKDIQVELHNELGGLREVIVASGKIDLLTTTQIIEVKEEVKWKEAVGQVIIYGLDYPTHKKRIHLFGEKVLGITRSRIKDYCQQLDIEVTWAD